MKKIKNNWLTLLFLMFTFPLPAEEGMWLLPWLDQQQLDAMHRAGLTLSREDLYAINRRGIKDAIVIFDRGCTGSIISRDGLILTNHHCGYDAVRALSSETNHLLEEGFWSQSFEEEIPAPGVTATFLVEVRDVTQRILSETDTITDPAIHAAILDALYYEIATEAIKGTPYEAEVAEFFEGSQYLLMIYSVYKDIRLVATPPASIGKFGGETDNWSWPRHTGDFALFRIYTDPQGRPSQFHQENVPLRPYYVLPISDKGYREGDFAMTMGYPGSTQRYITSFETLEIMETENRIRAEVRSRKLEIMKSFMDRDPAIRLAYTGKYYQSANYLKHAIEQNKALSRLEIPAKKQELENRFSQWAATQSDNTGYLQILPGIQETVEQRKQIHKAETWITEVFPASFELFNLARKHYRLYHILYDKSSSEITLERELSLLKQESHDFFKDYRPGVDKAIMQSLLPLYAGQVDRDYQPEFLLKMQKRGKIQPDRYLDRLYSRSFFSDSSKLFAFYRKPSLKQLKKDPAFQGMLSYLGTGLFVYTQGTQYIRQYKTNMRRYIEGLRSMDSNLGTYPDANSTLRLSWGNVAGYQPADGITYRYYTTLEGVMEKRSLTDPEFMVPETLEKLYREKDYGRWKDENGNMRVCFLTTNDITGGNSGSPVINGEGALIGLAFDGNQEGMAGDIYFDAGLQRTLCVDIRYILFLIEKLGKAERLLEEMNL